MNKQLDALLEQTIRELDALPSDADAQRIEQTASVLEGMNYQPLLLTDVPDMLRIRRDRVLKILRRQAKEQPDVERAIQSIRLLARQYQLLCRLRADEPEAWDEVNELMEDD